MSVAHGAIPVVFAPAVSLGGRGGLLLGCTHIVGEGTYLAMDALRHVQCPETAVSVHDAYHCAISLGFSAAAELSLSFDEQTLRTLEARQASIKGDSLSLAAFLSLIANAAGLKLPYERISASGAMRNEQGSWRCAEVGLIYEKLSIAERNGAQKFFVSAEQADLIPPHGQFRVEVVYLPTDAGSAAKTFLEMYSDNANRD